MPDIDNKFKQVTLSGSGVYTNVPQYVKDAVLGAGVSPFSQSALDAATGGGMAFLESELEKRDPKVREPLTSVTWMRDIVCKTGGGWVDYTSVFHVDYATTGPNNYGIMGGQTTLIPTVQADVGKDIYNVFNWGSVIKVTFIDLKKAQQIGRSLDEMLDKGVRLNYNKALDVIVYNGWGGYYGIVNDVSPSYTAAPNGASGSALWLNKTPEEIMYDINTCLVNTWANSQYDLSGMCDYILIPPAQYTSIVNRPVTLAGTQSILEYLLKNNIGKNQARDLQIFPSRWCIGAGHSSTDRMVGYVNSEDRLYFDITVPINRAMTMPSVETGGSYNTLYLAQVGPVKKLYVQPWIYMDGI